MAAVEPGLQSEILKDRFALESVRVPSVARRELQTEKAKVRSGIANLQAIDPPPAVADEHARLIAGYRALLTQLDGLKALTSQSTTDKVRVKAATLASAAATRQIAASLRAIIGKGYDLGFGSAG
jgi:hypothetical protein